MPKQSEPDRLVVELRRAWGGGAWHGPALSELLAGVDAAKAAARPLPAAHSIWELVLHLRSWTREVTRRLAGGAPGQPEDGDWPAVTDTSHAAWQEAVASLRAAHEDLVAHVGRLKARDLDGVVGDTASAPDGTGVTVREMLHGIAQHHAYHGGQVGLLARA